MRARRFRGSGFNFQLSAKTSEIHKHVKAPGNDYKTLCEISKLLNAKERQLSAKFPFA